MQGYVIGTNDLNLLKVKGHSIWEICCGANADEPAEIQIGYCTVPSGATIFQDWKLAKQVVDYIKEHHDTIRSTNNSIIGSMIDGNKLKDPNELKIYKILLHEVTEEDKDEWDCYREISKEYCECVDEINRL